MFLVSRNVYSSMKHSRLLSVFCRDPFCIPFLLFLFSLYILIWVILAILMKSHHFNENDSQMYITHPVFSLNFAPIYLTISMFSQLK